MTRDEQIAELIKKEAEAYGRLGEIFIDAFKTDLYKDLQELAVIEGKIEVLKALRTEHDRVGFCCEYIDEMTEQLEHQRIKLLTKLNLEL